MTGLKKYLAIILISVFAISTTATMAMAHCSDSAAGHETPQIDRKMDGCSHTHSTEEKTHDNDHTNEEKIQDDIDHTGDNDPHDSNQQTSCTTCDAGLCKTQNVVSAETTSVFYATSKNLHSEKDINLKAIFLSIIPEPPNSIS